MTAPDIVKDLVARFEQHRDAYRSGRYNETRPGREESMDRLSNLEKQIAQKREIESIDRQIDALVYELYALTTEAIMIVEGNG